jgi:muramoyltetrapeptide carboxypeptidase
MPFDKMYRCIEILEDWGFQVKQGKTLNNQYNYFSGTDEERLNDLQEMLDDENVKAIFCARGGYGLSRAIDKLNFDRFVDSPKWIIGYSDVTILHAHIYSNFYTASLHAPMAAAFNDFDEDREYLDSIFSCLTGKHSRYEISSHHLNKKGTAEGELIGGNLAILAHLIGTDSDFDTVNKILFLEDIGEYKYNIDRMLMQLKRAGKLGSLSALILGNFTDIKDTTIPFGQDIPDMILDKVQEYDYPVCFDFPAGHTGRNYALKIGVKHKLTVTDEGVILEEAR